MSHEERKVAVSNLEQKNNTSEEKENTESPEQNETLTGDNKENQTQSVDETPSEAVEETPKKETSSDEVPAETESQSAEDDTQEAESEDAPQESTDAEDEAEPKTEATDAEEKKEEIPSEDASSDEPEAKQVEESIENADEDPESVTDVNNSLEYYQDIVDRAKELVVQTDWTFVTTELANLSLKISEGPNTSNEKTSEILHEFESLKTDFEEKKKAHYEELNAKKAKNLSKKKELLKELTDIINEQKWTATKEVSKIRNKWESIKLLPQSEVEALEERYESLMQEFDDHKVDRLVKKLQKEEENLELKLLLMDKMDSIIEQMEKEGVDYKKLDKEFNDLLTQWRKVGRVPSEKNQMVWERYNKAQDVFNELRFKYDKSYRKKIEKALEKKKKLIKEAEALVDRENIAQAARKVNKLHKAWKKAGNLPQKEENEMWEAFKLATDAFNEKKSENIDVLREQENINYEKKEKLVERAKEIKDTDDFDKGHQQMQSLMDEWKKIGPVPRKKSSKIWKKFKGHMDDFYDRRRDHFKEQRKDHKENLARKNEILEKLRELGKHDDPALAVEEAKKLQEEFKNAGHVPIKVKNKVWKEYREACDVIYDRYRALGSDLGRERKLASEGIDPDSRKEIIKYEKERNKIKKEISRLEDEIIQYQEAKTYFKPTNKGNKLRDELQDKIDKAGNTLEKKEERLYEINKQIDLLSKTNEEESSDSNDEEE